MRIATVVRLAVASAGVTTLLVATDGGEATEQSASADTVSWSAGDPPALVPPLTDTLQATVDSTVAALGSPGAVVVVTTPIGSWETAVGVTDLDTGEPVVQGLSWPVRSITKSFTTTLVLQLADEGVLSLDDTIDAWVPGVPNGDRVTLRQLGGMTSGLADYTSQAWIDDFIAAPTREFSLDELVAYGTAEPPVAEPGAERVYTNMNTLLLGKVVETVTGEPFEAALDRRILAPLGLSTTVYPTQRSQWIDHPVGYAPDGGSLTPQPVNFSVFGPAGAAIATTDDLTTWGGVLARGDLIEPATQQQRLDGGVLERGPEYDRYAFGIGEIDGWWGHTGEGFGFTALVMHDTGTGTTVVIAMNVSDLDSHGPTTLFRRLAPLLVASPPTSPPDRGPAGMPEAPPAVPVAAQPDFTG